jgi:hypothetical protein
MKATGWVVLGALAAAPVAIPAPNDTVGRFVWHDLVTHDVAASQKFYAALLGWEFETTTHSGRPYVIARSGGQATGGMVKREDYQGTGPRRRSPAAGGPGHRREPPGRGEVHGGAIGGDP